MKLVVCVKEVLNTKVPLEVSESVVQKESVPIYMMNPSDRAALDRAVEMKASLGNVEIAAVTIGPARAREVLYTALAGGADEAIHIVDDRNEAADAYITALVLGKMIQRMQYAAIFCGNNSLDMRRAQVPSSLAELLDIPQVTRVTTLHTLSKERVRVQRRLDRGKQQILECPLPALFAVDGLATHPRYISVFAQMQASEREVHSLTLADMNLVSPSTNLQPLTRITRLTQARPRSKKIYIPDSSMSASQRMNYFLSGELGEKQESRFLEGSADYLADQIVEYLKQGKIMS